MKIKETLVQIIVSIIILLSIIFVWSNNIISKIVYIMAIPLIVLIYIYLIKINKKIELEDKQKKALYILFTIAVIICILDIISTYRFIFIYGYGTGAELNLWARFLIENIGIYGSLLLPLLLLPFVYKFYRLLIYKRLYVFIAILLLFHAFVVMSNFIGV